MSKKGKTDDLNPEMIEFDDDFFGIAPDDMDYDMFNPDLDIMPREFLELMKYKKLDKETKAAVKTLWGEIVSQYWEEHHQIPYGESFIKLRKELIEILADQGEMALSDDKDLKTVLSDNIIIIINKILKQEKRP